MMKLLDEYYTLFLKFLKIFPEKLQVLHILLRLCILLYKLLNLFYYFAKLNNLPANVKIEINIFLKFRVKK